MMKKDAFWKPLGGRQQWARNGEAWILGPPNYQFSKKTTHHSPHTINNYSRPARTSAVADIFMKGVLRLKGGALSPGMAQT